jgi:hypothetical protein
MSEPDEPDTVLERPSSSPISVRDSKPIEPEDVPTGTLLPGVSTRPSATTIRALRLELEDVIGTGGMGIVYRGEQTDLQRPVAFKQLAFEPTDEMRARFVREARLTARLEHPNIVPVHVLETGAEGEPTGYAMKLVEGKTLASLLREAKNRVVLEQSLEPEHTMEARLEIFLKVCDAMAFAHDRGIIHRDLKPANVMIGAFGAVYVMDWGIARPIHEADRVEPSASSSSVDDVQTQVGAVIGTASYMSPEQARGETATLDARSDQYALGLLLQEVITLEAAIPTLERALVLENVRAGRLAPLERADAGARSVPRELRAIVLRALSQDREDRYPTTRDLADDVRRYLRGEAVAALPEGPLARLLRFAVRHRRATVALVVLSLALSALAVVWSRYRATVHELSARERGAELTLLYRDVARQAARIDRQLFRMEESLQGLATAAEWALQGSEPSGPVYFDGDFADPARRPADFTDRTTYRWPVSVDHAVVGVAPGVDRTALLPKIRRIAPLVGQMRDAVISAALGDTVRLRAAEARQFLLERKSPIDYAYIDLAEGVHVVWPGVAVLPPNYDVRTSSFYRMSERKRGKRWGAPYVDATTDQAGDDLVLPCTQGLWIGDEFVGVAGVEITVTKMVETTMRLVGRTALRTRLVDARAGVIIDSRDARKRFVTTGTDDAVAFAVLDLPEVAAAIAAGEEGLREIIRDGQAIAVAFVRLDAIGWYYVVEVEASTLGLTAGS